LACILVLFSIFVIPFEPVCSIANAKENVTEIESVSIKVKDRDDPFYAAGSNTSSEDTLDPDDVILSITFKDVEKAEEISIEKSKGVFTIKGLTVYYETNIDDVRVNACKNQELNVTLKYKTSEVATTEIVSSNNPKVDILPSKTETITAIAIKAKDTKKTYYVDNGVYAKDKTLDAEDLEKDFTLIGTYEVRTPRVKDGSDDYEYIISTKTKELAFTSDDYKVTTNVNTIRNLIGKNQELTAALTYKDANNKEVTVKTVTAATAKSSTPVIAQTTANVTILAPEVINGILTVKPQNYGAKETDITSDKDKIQNALNLAGDGYMLVVYFPAGNYYIGNSLYIHSNTTLKLADGATIIRNSPNDEGLTASKPDREGVNHNILKISPYGTSKAADTSKNGGYTNGVNIHIEGGTFDGGKISEATSASNLLNLGHASGIIIKNATFKNCFGNHLIELVAVENAEISGCTFTGFRYVTEEINDDDGSTTYKDSEGSLAEAIQIDVAHKDSNSAWTSAYLTDDTPCNNINIHDNTFIDYPVAVGNHHYLDGHHHTNISVTNNTITGYKSMNSGIKLFGCDNSVASGNTITNYSTGVKASASTGFSITGNNISKATYGVIGTDASNGTITSNTISELTNQGVIVYGSGTSVSDISGNNIKNSNLNGIIIHASASATNVTNNTINNCSSCGIQVYGSGKVNNLIKNTITTCGQNGVQIYGSADVTNVKSNKITSCNGNGIIVDTSATAKTINSNTINTCNKYGIYVLEKASVKTMSSNTIKNIKKNGIYVKNDKIKVTFKSNKLTSVGSTAIKIDSKFSKKKKQKYTFAPKVISLNLGAGTMVTKASNLKKIKMKVGKKSYTKSTKAANYTFYFKKYTKSLKNVPVTFTDKYKNTVVRTVEIN
jgi:parallel beta-helix repeat protein